jgi:hypothetical protein
MSRQKKPNRSVKLNMTYAELLVRYVLVFISDILLVIIASTIASTIA